MAPSSEIVELMNNPVGPFVSHAIKAFSEFSAE
jgi:hypothetical protein